MKRLLLALLLGSCERPKPAPPIAYPPIPPQMAVSHKEKLSVEEPDVPSAPVGLAAWLMKDIMMEWQSDDLESPFYVFSSSNLVDWIVVTNLPGTARSFAYLNQPKQMFFKVCSSNENGLSWSLKSISTVP